MTPQLFCSDVDGTLLDRNRQISAATAREVRRHTAAGRPFLLTSSRMPRAMTHLQVDLGITGQPLIAYNGAYVIANGKTLHSRPIPLNVVAAVVEQGEELGLSVQLFYEDEWYAGATDAYTEREQRNTRTPITIRPLNDVLRSWATAGHGAHKVMVMGAPARIDELVEFLNPSPVHAYRSKDDYLELADGNISKLTGLEVLLSAQYSTLTTRDCAAFGDNYNDIDLLRGVGLGCAVGNARPEVKAVADRVLAANVDDGVAHLLAEMD